MYDCGIKLLTSLSKEDQSADSQMPDRMQAHFSRLQEDDSIRFIPADAAEQLSDAALDLLRKAERCDQRWEGGYLVKIAENTLNFANRVAAEQEKAATEITTAQDITAAKPLSLKKKDDRLSL